MVDDSHRVATSKTLKHLRLRLSEQSHKKTGKIPSAISRHYTPFMHVISPIRPMEFGAEKSKTLNLKSASASPFIRRTASLDTIYLAGQWPRDLHYLGCCGQLMLDKATQTPDEWEETDRKKSSQKKNSASSSEQLEMKYIRQRLQRTNQSGRGTGGSSAHQRHSPVQGDHSAISSTAAANGGTAGSSSSGANLPTSNSPSSPSTPTTGSSPHQLFCNVPPTVQHSATATVAAGGVPRTVPIPIPHIPKPLIPRMRNSVEGLNQEIERLVLKGISGIEGEAEQERVSMPVLEPTPDGHRAPIAELFRATRRSVNTQTPSGGGDSCPSSGTASRSQSISPVVPIIPGPMDSSRPPSMEDIKSASPDVECSTKLGTSPQLNKFLTREPPDGCEKVKIVEEARKLSGLVEAGDYCPPKPSVNFVLKPSQSSAFCPLHKGHGPPSTSDGLVMQVPSSPVERLPQ